jgi:hypothetical protein
MTSSLLPGIPHPESSSERSNFIAAFRRSSFIEIHILNILRSRNLFAALPVTSGTATFSLLSDGPRVEGNPRPFLLTKKLRQEATTAIP